MNDKDEAEKIDRSFAYVIHHTNEIARLIAERMRRSGEHRIAIPEGEVVMALHTVPNAAQGDFRGEWDIINVCAIAVSSDGELELITRDDLKGRKINPIIPAETYVDVWNYLDRRDAKKTFEKILKDDSNG